MGCGDFARRATGALVALLWAGLPACSFDPSGASGIGAQQDPDAAPGTSDGATPDATQVIECEAGEVLCGSHSIETCNDTGDGYVAGSSVVCPLSCEPGGGTPYCTAPSNIPEADAIACNGDHALTPGAGTTVTIRLVNTVERIECDPDCGGDETVIDSVGVIDQAGSEVAWFCLSSVSIPSGVNVVMSPSVKRSLAFLVDGNVNIAGSIAVNGRAAVADPAGTTTAAGQGGPGGFTGGAVADVGGDGKDGGGACPGSAGSIQNGDGAQAGSGGGGAGYAAAGGDGGGGKSNGTGGDDNDGTIVDGGQGGDADCADIELIPLIGGSGGASGGDASCAVACGWPGGGGGGALQISARGDLSVSGAINASGGAGGSHIIGEFGAGGAGGGGAGGAVLLEGSRLLLAGASIVVLGGSGGAAGAGAGGAGGGIGVQAGMLTGESVGTVPDDNEGGAGGGGAAGLVRLNAATAPSCGGLTTPTAACSAGVLADAN
ncbi:MAG TPA: hypothetical protein VMZ28_15380 [Kofleriaceae bacterium]|nr:hypothetical protein [Kofleriaceae bacterium]